PDRVDELVGLLLAVVEEEQGLEPEKARSLVQSLMPNPSAKAERAPSNEGPSGSPTTKAAPVVAPAASKRPVGDQPQGGEQGGDQNSLMRADDDLPTDYDTVTPISN